MPGKIIDAPPYRWKQVRVFISSTFRDFHAERDYLIKHVFPDVEEFINLSYMRAYSCYRRKIIVNKIIIYKSKDTKEQKEEKIQRIRRTIVNIPNTLINIKFIKH